MNYFYTNLLSQEDKHSVNEMILKFNNMRQDLITRDMKVKVFMQSVSDHVGDQGVKNE